MRLPGGTSPPWIRAFGAIPPCPAGRTGDQGKGGSRMYRIDIMTLFPESVGDLRRAGFLRKTSPPAAAERAF